MAPDRVLAAGDRLDAVLVRHHREFLAFLERRLGSRADAEEILQGAYARALEKGVPDDVPEGVVAWFFRVLRNALTDRSRRAAAERRSAERLAREPVAANDPELRDAVCACLHDLLPSMNPDYASIVQAVDLEERPIAEAAAGAGITVNNATVRLHRARRALKTQLVRACGACAAHGCLECRCRTGAGPRGRAST